MGLFLFSVLMDFGFLYVNCLNIIKIEINAKIRTTLSPRHVPDEIYSIPEVPRTLNAKKLEVPVKKILAGVPVEKAVNVDSMSNPKSIDFFVKLVNELHRKK